MRVSVVGLGKLGSPIVAVFAAKGYDVVGIDTNPVSSKRSTTTSRRSKSLNSRSF